MVRGNRLSCLIVLAEFLLMRSFDEIVYRLFLLFTAYTKERVLELSRLSLHVLSYNRKHQTLNATLQHSASRGRVDRNTDRTWDSETSFFSVCVTVLTRGIHYSSVITRKASDAVFQQPERLSLCLEQGLSGNSYLNFLLNFTNLKISKNIKI